MSDRDQPAFPRSGYWTQGMTAAFTPQTGMTLRDYFAVQALPAALATVKGANTMEEALASAAKASYMAADAMLKESAK